MTSISFICGRVSRRWVFSQTRKSFYLSDHLFIMNYLLLALLFQPLFVHATQECKDCVNSGCIYCKLGGFFDGEESYGECKCDTDTDDLFAHLQVCSSVKPLNSNLDCAFNTHLAPLIVTVMVVVFLALCYCCWKRRSGSGFNPFTIRINESGTTTTPASTVGGTTTTTTFATAIPATPPMAYATPVSNESNPPSYNATYNEGRTDIAFATAELEITVAGQPNITPC
jgi:hypothetical protein